MLMVTAFDRYAGQENVDKSGTKSGTCKKEKPRCLLVMCVSCTFTIRSTLVCFATYDSAY